MGKNDFLTPKAVRLILYGVRLVLLDQLVFKPVVAWNYCNRLVA